LDPRLTPAGFEELDGWTQDGASAAFDAFRRSAHRVLVKPYRTGDLGISSASFETAFAEARRLDGLDDEQARHFFETHFLPMRVGNGLVTGFYEPEAEASLAASGRFRYPLYGRPDDLVDVEGIGDAHGLDHYLAFARADGGRLVEYHDRAAIENGALAGRGLELFWLADRVDLFFIHVQGAARLRLPDGSVRRVTYAAKSGHRFTGPGRVLASLGEIPEAQVTMQSIRAWLGENPGRADEILHRNRSFIFFREAPVDDGKLGPVAAAKVPLTPGRSIAVDRLIHTFATPVHVAAPSLDAFGGSGFRRLMIAQDTGSAITGIARGDLFAGSGDAAGEIAGVVRHEATFHVLVPRAVAGGAS
jgi:membrane-bound lytic murein transglycosylase A